jgi:hypothetical protein
MHSVLYTSYSVLDTILIMRLFRMCENDNIEKNLLLCDIMIVLYGFKWV